MKMFTTHHFCMSTTQSLEKTLLNKYIKIFKAVEEICNIEGCTPWELTDYRHRKSMDMLDAIKQEHGLEVYNKVYNSL